MVYSRPTRLNIIDRHLSSYVYFEKLIKCIFIKIIKILILTN